MIAWSRIRLGGDPGWPFLLLAFASVGVAAAALLPRQTPTGLRLLRDLEREVSIPRSGEPGPRLARAVAAHGLAALVSTPWSGLRDLLEPIYRVASWYR